jgi:hypothetical protein
MFRRRLVIPNAAAAVLLALALTGCDKPKPRAGGGPSTIEEVEKFNTAQTTQPAAPLTRPSTLPITTLPTTAPQARATTEPALSFLVVDGRLVEFPAAKVILNRKDGRIKARLFSDNPKSALEETYAGNSFYFDMPLEADPEQPGQWVWRYKSPDSERSDSPNGVYLNGLKTHLQPFDVLVQVDNQQPRRVQVQVVPPSQFRAFDKDGPADASRLVTVNGNLVADVVMK